MIKVQYALLTAAVVLAGCSTGSAPRDEQQTFEQKYLQETKARQQQADAAAREAKLARERDELARLLEERKRREDSAAQVNPFSEAKIDGSALSAPTSPLTIPELSSQSSIQYDYDSFAIRPEYQPVLEAHAAMLHARPDLRLSVEGNCDERGSREYNLALGQRRADTVKRALVLLGVPANQISTVSFGSEKPKATGHSEEDLAQNRRSDLIYIGQALAKRAQ